MKILHLTETTSADALTLIDRMARRQIELEADARVHRGGGTNRTATLLASIRRTRGLLRSGEYDVIHAHGPAAGAATRIARAGVSTHTAVFYSPHGYAFLRPELSAATRWLSLLTERALTAVGEGTILTSPSEYDEAIRTVRTPDAYLIDSCLPDSHIRSEPPALSTRARVRVGVLRCPGEDAATRRGAALTAALTDLGDLAECVWIGGSADDATRHRNTLDRDLDTLDLLVHPGRWAGLPLAVIEAQSRGIPAIVSDAVGSRDSVSHGTTGYVCTDDDDLIHHARELILSPALRHSMSHAALAWAHERAGQDVGGATLAIYSGERLVQDAPLR